MDDLEKALQASYEAMKERGEIPEAAPEPDGIAEQTPVGTVDAPEVEQPSTQAPRARDANGQFIKADKAPEEAEPSAKQPKASEARAPVVKDTDQPTTTGSEPATAIAPPQSWSAQDKAAWSKVPPDVQAIIARREAELHKGISEQGTKYAEKARVADELSSAAAPYQAMLQAEGATPVTAFKSLMNTAYTLRAGTPAQRIATVQQICRQFGVDLSAVATGEAPYVDPHLAHTQSEVLQLKQQLAERQYAEQQASMEQTQQTITAFQSAADADGKPKHPFFEEVKADMAALLQSGRATDLAAAYEQAVWANPGTRARLLADQAAKAEADRVAEAKRKAAEAAKAAGTRVTSSDPQPEAKVTPRSQNDLEAEMRRIMRQRQAA